MVKSDIERMIASGQFGNDIPGITTTAPTPTTITIADSANTWEPPIPFDADPIPDFPVDALPAPLNAFVAALAESTQTPPEMAGLLSLGVLATAFQRRFDVQITPDWKEPLCLYTVAVAPPGERKSAVISALTKPIFDFEREQRELMAGEIAQNKTQRELLEKRLEAAKNAAVRSGDDSEALELSAKLAGFQDLHELRLVVDDTTPEKLADIMARQGGAITITSAEGGLFDSLKGRYENKGGLNIYLKGHAGDYFSDDRMGRSGSKLDNPRLTMILTVQPEVIQGLLSDRTFRGRGLCGRFLYVVGRSKIGERNVNPVPIPSNIRADYRAFVRRILSGRESGTVYLSPEADRRRQAFQAGIEKLLADKWESMRDWAGKLTGATVRIAALIHCATVRGDPTGILISAETMEAAEKIACCLACHAEVVYQQMGADPALTEARYLLKRLAGKTEISRRDLFRKCHGHFRKAAELSEPLEMLSEMGYIRTETDGTGGRPSEKIKVNPLWDSAKSDKSHF